MTTPLDQALDLLGITFADLDALKKLDLSERDIALLGLLTNLEGGGGGGGGGGSGEVRIPTFSEHSADYEIAAGAKWVYFIFSADFEGTISGYSFPGADFAGFELPILPGNDTYQAITTTVTAGSYQLAVVR